MGRVGAASAHHARDGGYPVQAQREPLWRVRDQEILAGENCETRLELARATVDGSGIGKSLPNTAGDDAECCYIRLHERGHEAKRLLSRYGR